MLKVQEFLRNGNTLNDLSILYNIQYEICESLGVVILNYSNISPITQMICKECRGLILELDTWEIVFKSLDWMQEDKDYASQDSINWNNAVLLEKLDGALVFMYYYKDAWRVGQRLSADASNIATAINGVLTDLNFDALTRLTINDMGYTWEEYASKLDKNLYYSFELCAPETRFGVIYRDRKLVLLAAINKKSLEEVDIYSLDFPNIKPKRYEVNNLDEVKSIVEKYSDPLKYEGFILVDGFKRRYKYKNPEYVSMMSDPVMDTEIENVDNLLDYVLSFTTVEPPTPTIVTITSWDMGMGTLIDYPHTAWGAAFWVGESSSGFDVFAPGNYTYSGSFTIPQGATDLTLDIMGASDNTGSLSVNGTVVLQDTWFDSWYQAVYPSTTIIHPGSNSVVYNVVNEDDYYSPVGCAVWMQVSYYL